MESLQEELAECRKLISDTLRLPDDYFEKGEILDRLFFIERRLSEKIAALPLPTIYQITIGEAKAITSLPIQKIMNNLSLLGFTTEQKDAHHATIFGFAKREVGGISPSTDDKGD